MGTPEAATVVPHEGFRSHAAHAFGHSGIDITLDIYSPVLQAVKPDAAAQIAAMFDAGNDA